MQLCDLVLISMLRRIPISDTINGMKVLHILSGDLWAGAEVQAYTLLAELGRTPSVQVAAALMNEGELADRLRKLSIPVTVLPENHLNVWQLLRRLSKLMSQWQPDIVHTHRFKEDILGSLANQFGPRARCIRTAHGAPETMLRGWQSWPQRTLASLHRWCASILTQKTIAVTADLAAKLATHYPAKRIIVIENGIDIEAVRTAARDLPTIAFDPIKTHIGIAGRLAPVKRTDLFLEAAAIMRRQDPEREWEFHLFGEGPLRQSLLSKAQALDLISVMHFHGHRNDVAACIARLDVLIMCSDHEGLPMTLLEAMAMGTTVVGHAVGGIAQLLQGDTHGWPVTDHTGAGYAHAVRKALADPTAKAIRAHAAASNVEMNYSAALCAKRHLTLYSEVLSASSAGTSPV